MIQHNLHSIKDFSIDLPSYDHNEEASKPQPNYNEEARKNISHVDVLFTGFDEQNLGDELKDLTFDSLKDSFNSLPQPSLVVSSSPSISLPSCNETPCQRRSLLQSSEEIPGEWTRTSSSSYDPTARRLYNRSMKGNTMS
eukprot:746603-Hanusia_phi.AAC.2